MNFYQVQIRVTLNETLTLYSISRHNFEYFYNRTLKYLVHDLEYFYHSSRLRNIWYDLEYFYTVQEFEIFGSQL